MEDELLPLTTRVWPRCSPGGTHDRIGELGVDVHDLSLALIAPLGAEHDDAFHRWSPSSQKIRYWASMIFGSFRSCARTFSGRVVHVMSETAVPPTSVLPAASRRC